MKKRWLALLAALLVVGAISVPALAQQSDTEPSDAVASEAGSDEGDYGGCEGPIGDEHEWDLSEEELAEINAEMEALADAFDTAGIDYTVVDEDGISWVDWDYEDDEANAVADQFYQDRYGDELEWTPSDEELAEINAETDGLVQYLADQGFTVAVETDEFGIRYPAFTENDENNEALWEALEAFLEDHYGDDLNDDFDWDVSEEELAEINAEMEALADAFDTAGITYTIVDEDGISWVDWDYEDDEANAVADQFYQDRYGDELEWTPSDEELAEIQAEADEFRAFLDSEGISYELETDEFGITWPEVDEADLEALEGTPCLDDDADHEQQPDDADEEDVAA